MSETKVEKKARRRKTIYEHLTDYRGHGISIPDEREISNINRLGLKKLKKTYPKIFRYGYTFKLNKKNYALVWLFASKINKKGVALCFNCLSPEFNEPDSSNDQNSNNSQKLRTLFVKREKLKQAMKSLVPEAPRKRQVVGKGLWLYNKKYEKVGRRPDSRGLVERPPWR